MFFNITAIIVSYFLGAIPSAYVFGRIFGKINIMEHGSGNVGTTNTFRVLGQKVGFLVFLFDVSKGFLSAWLGSLAGGTTLAVVCGIIAVLGHTFSIFIHFKGGKGVATGSGVLLFIAPAVLCIVALIWLLVAFFSSYISLASIVAAVSTILLLLLFRADTIVIVCVSLVCIYIIIKHRSNIKRLLNGTENKIKWKEKVFGK